MARRGLFLDAGGNAGGVAPQGRSVSATGERAGSGQRVPVARGERVQPVRERRGGEDRADVTAETRAQSLVVRG